MRVHPCWLVLMLSAGCGGGWRPAETNLPDAGAAPIIAEPFIALDRDFAGFDAWRAFTLPPGGEIGGTHTSGQRTVYLNRTPPHGSLTFPVGTILLKTVEATPADHQIFAMVKRGGGFNADGAVGWEWFSIARDERGTPIVIWRGLGPADGTYGGTGQGCNDCHTAAMSNDYVQAPELQLSKL